MTKPLEDQIALHKAIDAEWRPIAAWAAKVSPWALLDAMRMWRDEKVHADRMGCRMPMLVNITAPKDYE